MYNAITGSNITHFDVADWGVRDHMDVMNALWYKTSLEKLSHSGNEGKGSAKPGGQGKYVSRMKRNRPPLKSKSVN